MLSKTSQWHITMPVGGGINDINEALGKPLSDQTPEQNMLLSMGRVGLPGEVTHSLRLLSEACLRIVITTSELELLLRPFESAMTAAISVMPFRQITS
jgi:hypothetical protein